MLWGAYFLAKGKASTAPFKAVPMPTPRAGPVFVELTVVANFAEVFLAKEGHHGLVMYGTGKIPLF